MQTYRSLAWLMVTITVQALQQPLCSRDSLGYGTYFIALASYGNVVHLPMIDRGRVSHDQ